MDKVELLFKLFIVGFFAMPFIGSALVFYSLPALVAYSNTYGNMGMIPPNILETEYAYGVLPLIVGCALIFGFCLIQVRLPKRV